MVSLAATTNTGGAVARPRRTGAYYAASALHNAGFRGWPLVIMTAVAGRESKWNPSQVNPTDPNGGSYGLLQINGGWNTGYGQATNSWASQILQPQQNADEAYRIAGGNSLSGLGNWALSWNGQANSIPTPTANEGQVGGKLVPINYTIAPWIPESIAAASAASLSPASPNQIANVNAWPKTTTSPLPLSASSAAQLGLSGGVGPGNAQGCGTKGNLFKIPLGPQITWCEVKALGGGLAIAGGGLMMIIGLSLMVVAGLENKGPARVIVQPAQQTVRAVQRYRPRRTPPAAPAPAQTTSSAEAA